MAEAKQQCENSLTLLVKGCGHFVSTVGMIKADHLTRVFEAGSEFPCALCNKASNVYIPVYPKALRQALLAFGEGGKKETPSLFSLLKGLADPAIQSNKATFVDNIGFVNKYPESSISCIKEALEKGGFHFTEAIDKFINTYLDFKKDAVGTIAKDFENLDHTFNVLKEWTAIAEVMGYASFIKQFGSAMESRYLSTRLISIANFSAYGKKKAGSLEDSPFGDLENYYINSKLAEGLLAVLLNDEELKKTSIAPLFNGMANYLVVSPDHRCSRSTTSKTTASCCTS